MELLMLANLTVFQNLKTINKSNIIDKKYN